MKEGYREMLKSLERRAYSASLRAGGVLALFLLFLLLLAATLVFNNLQRTDQSYTPLLVISLVGAFFSFFGACGWYIWRAREYMRSESIELDLTHPGFYDYYRQWQQKIDEITTSSGPIT